MLKNRLKELRKRENITQVQFARIFDISAGTIAMWETGKREPDIDTIIKIADYFNVSVDYLLGKSENKKAPTGDNTDGHINVVKIRGRDGSFVEKHLTDEQLTLLKGMIEQFPEADFE